MPSAGSTECDHMLGGKLFYHVRGVLGLFLRCLLGLAASFRLLQVNALKLPDHLEPDESFSRIEVWRLLGYISAVARY